MLSELGDRLSRGLPARTSSTPRRCGSSTTSSHPARPGRSPPPSSGEDGVQDDVRIAVVARHRERRRRRDPLPEQRGARTARASTEQATYVERRRPSTAPRGRSTLFNPGLRAADHASSGCSGRLRRVPGEGCYRYGIASVLRSGVDGVDAGRAGRSPNPVLRRRDGRHGGAPASRARRGRSPPRTRRRTRIDLDLRQRGPGHRRGRLAAPFLRLPAARVQERLPGRPRASTSQRRASAGPTGRARRRPDRSTRRTATSALTQLGVLDDEAATRHEPVTSAGARCE